MRRRLRRCINGDRPRQREKGKIRPLTEPIPNNGFHISQFKSPVENLEAVQKRTIHIIYNSTRRMRYLSVLFYANLNSLASRRENLSHVFFCNIMDPASCLHSLIPPPFHSNCLKAKIFPNLSQSLYLCQTLLLHHTVWT